MNTRETIDATVVCLNKGDMARLESARKTCVEMGEAGIPQAAHTATAIETLQALGGTIVIRKEPPPVEAKGGGK